MKGNGRKWKENERKWKGHERKMKGNERKFKEKNDRKRKGNERKWMEMERKWKEMRSTKQQSLSLVRGGSSTKPILAVFGYRFVIVPVIVLNKVFDREIFLKISEAYLAQTAVPLIWDCLLAGLGLFGLLAGLQKQIGKALHADLRHWQGLLSLVLAMFQQSWPDG